MTMTSTCLEPKISSLHIAFSNPSPVRQKLFSLPLKLFLHIQYASCLLAVFAFTYALDSGWLFSHAHFGARVLFYSPLVSSRDVGFS